MGRNDPVVIDGLRSLSLGLSQPPIYDRPIGLRLLYHDPESGAVHYLVHYPPALVSRWHKHTSAHTIIVLEGRLEANGQLISAGSYCHFPAGCRMRHTSADGESCLFVTIFSGPFDVFPLE